ncbi:Helitron helicase [Phytophthora megakarya]|uniref:Helitron helicase n=1 Tax=Phytophthora megakarya TaxID=4795 RepID=A0A225VYZ8_9STRA|nr:Helitron helicase [Phytophthora megakarya]
MSLNYFSRERSGCSGTESSNLGRKVIIPHTFTDGPRYMYQHFLDAMAIVRETGAPNLFITMTPSIDLISWCVGLVKLKALNQDLDEGVLGGVASKVRVVEYQKRGLLHAHILLIMRPQDKPVSAEGVDRLVSAELPDKATHLQL